MEKFLLPLAATKDRSLRQRDMIANLTINLLKPEISKEKKAHSIQCFNKSRINKK